MAESPERRARFTREAQAIAALNHPNIVTLYSVEEAGSVLLLTMELVKGKTLPETRPTTGFDLARFFAIAISLTDALVAAHQQGIAHRDLKPTNVMISDDGRVKVLDFGLAKAFLDVSGRSAGEFATRSATYEGRVVGTPAYMSPEQATARTIADGIASPFHNSDGAIGRDRQCRQFATTNPDPSVIQGFHR